MSTDAVNSPSPVAVTRDGGVATVTLNRPDSMNSLDVATKEALLSALRERLPDFTFRPPAGGLAVWCELPSARASALADEAERRGVAVTPGPVFAVEGGLDRFVRIPWTRPADELTLAVERIAQAWDVVRERVAGPGWRPSRMTVA